MRKLRNGKPPKRNIEVDAALHRVLKKYADDHGMKLLAVVDRVIREGLRSLEQPPK